MMREDKILSARTYNDKVFYTVSHEILIEKLLKCGLDEQ